MADREISLDVAIKELEQFEAEMEELKSKVLSIIGEEYKADFSFNIDEEKSPDGTPFFPLKEISKFPKKSSRDPANHILFDTQELHGSFRRRTGSDQVSIYTELDYAGPQQEGILGRLIARPFVGLSKRANERIGRRLEPLKTTEERAAFIESVMESLNAATATNDEDEE